MVRRTFVAVSLIMVATASVSAQPAERPGRFSMAPAEGGGFVRLDTDTGAMAICQRTDSDWTCRDIHDADRQLLLERNRLATENKQLKSDLRRLEDLVVANSNKGLAPKGDRQVDRFSLPSEEEVDKALSYVERMFRKFREKLNQLEGSRGAQQL